MDNPWQQAWTAWSSIGFRPGALRGTFNGTAGGTAGGTGPEAAAAPWTAFRPPWQDAVEYGIDAAQRWILLLDTLRRRGNQVIEHAERGKPPVLDFRYSVEMDGRTLERPCNYLLLRILPNTEGPNTEGPNTEGRNVEGPDTDGADGADGGPPRARRPFVVVDPRAGHGPGIGGFKPDSQIGAALQAGHPCYFISFLPEPAPGQTLEDVGRAEAAFIEHVGRVHADADGKPCVIGNCQAGWAVMGLSAARPELMGPIILAGSPLSYWTGVRGRNPMRYLGGLTGGSWLAALASDLGNGRFDGAHLVGNFERLDPANSYWKKLYNLYAAIDTEEERFLAFERWWNGIFLMNGAEIEAITDNLFVGNKLTSGGIVTGDGRRLDLRNVRSPILVFASFGDNITPPQQALGWILDLYDSVDEIRAREQTIVYNLHHDIGHLGIFVSGRVGRKETAEFIENIDLIDVLPPGLYEMVIEPKRADMPGDDMVAGRYVSRFEHRGLDDIRAFGGNAPEDDLRFATVARVSEINKGLYELYARPWIRAAVDERTAEALRLANPKRAQHLVLSDLNPLMAPVGALAERVRADRRPAALDNPFLAAQTMMSDLIGETLDLWRDRRDLAVERVFLATYGSPLLQALTGLAAPGHRARPPRVRDEAFEALVEKRTAEIRTRLAEGGPWAALVRVLVYTRRTRDGADERSFQMLRKLREEYHGDERRSLERERALLRDQIFLMQLDEAAAMAALPALVPDPKDRKEVLAMADRVLTVSGPLPPDRRARFRQAGALLNGQTPARRSGAESTVGRAAAEIGRRAAPERRARGEPAR